MGLDRNLADEQVATVPGFKRTNAAPWRDGGGNREFSPWQAATLLFLNEDNTFRPFLASSWSVTDDQTTFTFKIREDAIYQDGTPIKASELKAYWEHGGKPENIVAWGGSMLLGLRDIKGMQDLMAGDTTVAEGLVAVDDNTLQVTMEMPNPTFPHVVTIDQTGFTKLDQVLADPEDWHFAPIGVGPYAMVIDKDTGYTEIIRVDLNGMSWWGEQFILGEGHLPRRSRPAGQADHVRERRGRVGPGIRTSRIGGAESQLRDAPVPVHRSERRPVAVQPCERPRAAGGRLRPAGADPRAGHADDGAGRHRQPRQEGARLHHQQRRVPRPGLRRRVLRSPTSPGSSCPSRRTAARPTCR